MSRILVTSALPYINGIKHLGNLVGSMLPADVYARFQRARGHEVLFICATDEHGTPAELAAREAGVPVADYCREQHLLQKEVGERFFLNWNYFGRSSSPQNRELTQHFADRLDDNGLIEARTIRQVYSIDDGRFLPDRYIVGTCPKCGYDRARGDQCENCTSVLDPTDLIDARSAISGSKNLEVRESRHLYLKQSAMVNRLREWIDAKTDWPALVRSIAYKWLDEGLEDRGITRDLEWGIPVAHDGKWSDFAGKVFYVWFDAPIEYIAATKEWADEAPGERDWKSWWYGEAAEDVRYVQFMGKDNVPFHTVGFPITLIGSGEPWKLVDYIKGLNWMNYYGGKFSTSQKRGVFMDQALDILPADYWRYYLMANIPENSDSSFTWEQLVVAVNKDLADVLGNFVNRLLRFAHSRFGDTAPPGGKWSAHEDTLLTSLAESVRDCLQYFEALDFRKAVHELRRVWTIGNEYLSVAGPWILYAADREQAAYSTRIGLGLIRLYAVLSHPIVPGICDRMLAALSLSSTRVTIPDWMSAPDSAPSLKIYLQDIPVGQRFSVPDLLVRKIEDSEVDAWISRFGGL